MHIEKDRAPRFSIRVRVLSAPEKIDVPDTQNNDRETQVVLKLQSERRGRRDVVG